MGDPSKAGGGWSRDGSDLPTKPSLLLPCLHLGTRKPARFRSVPEHCLLPTIWVCEQLQSHFEVVSNLKRGFLPKNNCQLTDSLRWRGRQRSMLSGLDLVLVVHQRLVADDQVSALEILTTSTYHATTTTTRPPNVPGPRDSEESSTWPAVLVAPRPSGVKHGNESSSEEVI